VEKIDVKTRSADLGSVEEEEITMHDQGLLLDAGLMILC
jgi:hypothetical protein